MDHILRLLSRHGIKQAAATLMFMPERITARYSGGFEDMELRFFLEDKPLGTAGSVLNTYPYIKDSGDVLVISGDAICDIDITAAVRFHKEKNADATLVLSRSTRPLEYGVVLTGADGRIQRFIEKPAWSQTVADTVNTGIYILSQKVLKLIPPGVSYDFGKDLFRKMLCEGYSLYGYVDDGYWCDIGDLSAYYICNMDALEGRIKGIVPPKQDGKGVTPFCIGRDTQARDSAVIGPHAVIGSRCRIAEGAVIERSIVHDSVYIAAGAVIRGAVICRGAVIGEKAYIPEGCVIGENSVIGKRVTLSKNVKVYNDKTIGEGIHLMSSLAFGDVRRDLFDDNGISGSVDTTLSPEYCVRLGAACGYAAGGKNTLGRIGVMHCGSAQATLVADALLCGVLSSGAKSYSFAQGFTAMAAFTAGHFRLDALLYVDRDPADEGGCVIKIFDRDTLSPARSFERRLESFLAREDSKRAGAGAIYRTEVFDSIKFLYFSELVKSAGTRLDGFTVALDAEGIHDSGSCAHILAKALTELGATVYDAREKKVSSGVPVIKMGQDGFNLEVCQDGACIADFWHVAAILQEDAIKTGNTVISLPYLAPDALGAYAEHMGATVLRYLSCPSEDSEEEKKAREAVFSQLFLKDAAFASMRLCCVLHHGKTTVGQLADRVPPFHYTFKDVDADDEGKTFIMRRLSSPEDGKSECTPRGEGIKLIYDKGQVIVVPRRRGGFRLYSEAANSEAAQELLSEAMQRVLNAADERNGR